MLNLRHFLQLALVVTLFCLLPTVFAQGLLSNAGKVIAARGAVTAQQGSEGLRILGRDAEIFTGDVITTGSRSFVVMKLNDGTRMSLRPGTSFRIDEWVEEDKKESAVFRLFKGGLRAISGAIAKRNPNAFKLRTTVATIGIRGTTFDARLCDEGCKSDAEKYKEVPATISAVVGRVGFLKGSVKANRNEAGLARNLTVGAPIYEGDSIVTATGSFTVLLFKDRSRVTLRANSEFVIASLTHKNSVEDSAIFRLVRGGLRAVTGLIGKRRPASVKYRTAIATIGIRGTGFDMFCQGTCEPVQSSAGNVLEIRNILSEMLVRRAFAATAKSPGLIVAPWDSDVVVERSGGNIDVLQGQILLIPADGSEPIFLPALPDEITEPRPEEVELDEELLLASEDPDIPEVGLYLACHEGHCLMGEVPLGEGEAAYSSGEGQAVPTRFEIIPQFLTEDPYFKTVDIDPGVLDIFGISLDPSTLECSVE